MREEIAKEIKVAAETSNKVVEMMQDREFATSKVGLTTAIAISLVGINQALVAIGQALLMTEEEKHG